MIAPQNHPKAVNLIHVGGSERDFIQQHRDWFGPFSHEILCSHHDLPCSSWVVNFVSSPAEDPQRDFNGTDGQLEWSCREHAEKMFGMCLTISLNRRRYPPQTARPTRSHSPSPTATHAQTPTKPLATPAARRTLAAPTTAVQIRTPFPPRSYWPQRTLTRAATPWPPPSQSPVETPSPRATAPPPPTAVPPRSPSPLDTDPPVRTASAVATHSAAKGEGVRLSGKAGVGVGLGVGLAVGIIAALITYFLTRRKVVRPEEWSNMPDII
jgi:hypothetical protein